MKVIYTCFCTMIGVAVGGAGMWYHQNGYVSAIQDAAQAKTQASVLMAEVHSELTDRCLQTLNTCKAALDEREKKYENVSNQYDKLTSLCYENNSTIRAKMVQFNHSMSGTGGP